MFGLLYVAAALFSEKRMGVMKRMAGGRRTSNFVGVSGQGDVNLSVDNSQLVLMLDRLVYAEMIKTNDVRRVFRKVMAPVRKAVMNAAKGAMPNDPRNAWQGVRLITLKKGAGAVVGLLDQNGPVKSLRLHRKPRGGKSGIVRHRAKSDRTKTVESYFGKDRAWILRIVNQGTVNGQRYAGTRGTLKTPANRGTITAKKFFRVAEPATKQAETSLANELGMMIQKVSKG